LPSFVMAPIGNLVNKVLDVALALGQAFLRTPPGQTLQANHLFQYICGVLWSMGLVFFQKWGMLHLPQIDQLGEPTPGLTAIVTGPTSGIGKETAAALARRGAKVVLACRSKAKGEALKAEIEKGCTQRGLPAPSIEIRLLDLASLQSVRAFSEQWEKEGRELHILVNNAGIYAMGVPREETCDGFEAHMGCNHLGHFLLTLSLLPSLERGAKSSNGLGARVVNVSSSVHMMAPRGVAISDPHLARKGAYSSELAYGQSKLAQILFTRELRARLQKKGLSGIHVFALHPGMVLTDVTRSLPYLVRKGNEYIMGLLLLTPSEGARASVYCATAQDAPAAAPSTCGYFDANCRPIQPSQAAQDEVAASWLWRWSAQQVRLPSHLDLPRA